MMKGPFNSKFTEGAFTLPCKWDLSTLLNGEEKVAVVSIVGQSEIEDGCDKTTPLSFILSRSISSCSPLVPLQLDESLVHLEGWYDSSRHTIFLHLVAAQDLALFAGGVQVIDDLLREKDPLVSQNLLEQQYLRALVLVFSLSHIILWNSTTHLLDTATITTLRSLNNIRTAVLPHTTAVLQELPGVCRTWAAAGRLCCPRMLFIFSSALLDAEQMAEEMTVDMAEVDSSDPTPQTAQHALRAVELSLEDQIYRLFRRTWIITNNSGNSITALPSSQQYVYLLSPHQRQQAVPDTAAEVLDHLCHGSYKEDPLPHGLTLNGVSAYDNVSEVLLLQECAAVRGGGARKKKRAVLDLLAANLLADMVTDTEANMEHRFSTFLQQHIDLALGDGFDDNIGRGAPAPIFMLPNVKTWFAAANRLYNLFVRPEHDLQVSPAALASLSPCSPQLQLLRLACQQTGQAALQQYRDHLPRHYARHVHRTKVRECLALYDASCCSGAVGRQYRAQLLADCEEEWRGERQGCEQLSLSGHTCQHGRHQHPTTLYRGAVIPSHNFGVSFLKFCNCGHRGGKLPDSSVLRHMNYDFYAELLTICCERLECYRFPSLETGPCTVWVPAAPKTESKSCAGPSSPPVPSGLDGVGALTASMCRRLRLEQEASQRSGGVYTPWDPVCDRIPVVALDGGNAARDGGDSSDSSDGHQSDGSEALTGGDAISEHGGDGDDAHYEHGGDGGDAQYEQGEDSDSLVEQDYEDGITQDSGSLAGGRRHECGAESSPHPRSSSVGSCSNNTQSVGSKSTQQQPSVSSHSHPATSPHLLGDSFMLSTSGGEAETVGEQEEAEGEKCEDGGDEEYQQMFQMEPMLSSESPDGFLPVYSSWSLTCVGPSSLYSHNIGIIDQPGFISGSNYLLPWDVKVKVNNKSEWCAIADSFSRKNKGKMNISSDEFCVKLFLGMEYECGQGHRFLMSSPSTVLMCPTGQPTTSAHSIATSAMPLYCKCLCSKNSPSPSEACLGQLMRLHVITPKAPVSVELRPQVAPGPAPCPRYFPQPPSASRIQLSSAAYWVLRLPNIYVSAATGPYYPPDPTQPVTVHNGHLLPGCFSITEAPLEK